MCLAVPGKIIRIEGNKGTIEIGNVKREAFMDFVPKAKVGDYILMHAGCAIGILDEEEALKTLEILRELCEDDIC